jgi:hypothetical protein
LRPPPVLVFVVAALALAGGMGIVATRQAAAGATDDGPALPNDATSFGFTVRSTAGTVPILESTRPFSLALSHGAVHGVPPTRDRFSLASAFVTRELARYPAAFLRKVRLAGVVLTEDLAENEMAIPSLPNVGGLLLLDASSVESDLVRSLHHEIFHFFDLADDGRVTPDPDWDKLNASGFAYGSGGRTLRGAWAARPADGLQGFVSAYATSGDEEDKADTFAFAVARPQVTKSRMVEDEVLRTKIVELARRVATFDPDCPKRLGFDVLVEH